MEETERIAALETTRTRGGTVPRYTLLVLRVWVGMTWARAGWNKLTTEDGWVATLMTSVERSRPHSLFKPFLDGVVVPHAVLFATLVSWGELLVGVSLLLGAGTRFGASVGMFLSLNYMLLQNRFFPGYDGTLFVAQLVLLLSASGRAFGADAYLHRRWPRPAVW